MATIYVVTAGEYSDYHIIVATTDKERAEKIKAQYNSENDRVCCYGGASIEEYEDSEEAEVPIWTVLFDPRGKVYSTSCDFCAAKEKVVFRSTGRIPMSYSAEVTVRAKDKETAIKAAAERRAKAIAEKEGL